MKGGDWMRKMLKKPETKRTEMMHKVRIMDTRGSQPECTPPGGKYQGCVNPRGCGCTAC